MFVAIARGHFRKPQLLLVSSIHCLSGDPPRRISAVHLDPTIDPATARSNCQITLLSREGRISDARHLFDETPHRDLITWSALISGYIRCGNLREARTLFDRPDAKKNVITWTALLSGYIRSGRIQEAAQLFNQIPDKNVVSYNTMIEGYFASGLIDKACDLFDRMPMRNVVSWNTMLTGLSQGGRVEEAYELFCQMKERDIISWTAMVAGLAQNGKVDMARSLFEKMPERNVVSWNAMISGYTQNGRVEEALELFERMPGRDMPSWNVMITGLIQNGKLERARRLFDEMGERNVVTWTTLITGYVQCGENEMALKLFLGMLADGIRPNEGTFVNVLPAISNLATLQEGQQVHQMISKTPFLFKPFVNSSLINMYSKCGEIGVAQKVFELASHKDVVSWNAMIAAFSHHGLGREAVRWFEYMQQKGFKPNDVTYVELLSACSHSGLFDEGLMLFKSLVRDGTINVREDHYTCLVDLCCRAGRLEEAMNLMKGLKIKLPASVWGALLAGCNNHRNVKIADSAAKRLSDMEPNNVNIADLAAKRLFDMEPNNAGTYTLLSNVYASVGNWKESKKIRRMMKDRGLKKQPGCSWIDVGTGVHVFVVQDRSHSAHDLIYSVVKDIHCKMKTPSCTHLPDDYTVNDVHSMVV